MFQQSAQIKFAEIINFEMAVKTYHEKNYDIADAEKVAIIKNWLGIESLHLIKTLTIE